jgi:hypothetical protein
MKEFLSFQNMYHDVEPFRFITIIIQGEGKELDEHNRNEQENENKEVEDEGMEHEEERIFETLKMWRMNTCLTKRWLWRV